MKKTFTILATVILITTVAFAQYNGNHQRDNNYDNNDNGRNNRPDIVINDNPNRGGGYNDRGGRGFYFSEREKNMQINKINNEYFYKIQSVKNKYFMGRHQKDRIIIALQCQKDEEISSVLKRFNGRDNRYDRRYDRQDDHDRRNW